jgi:GTP cyclohydrolase II
MRKVAAEKRGVILYLRQEGRGIGLVNKIHAYRLQDGGADTVEANQELGFAPDQRNYRFVEPMLEKLGVKSLRLMTNNPRKIDAIELMGIEIVERVPIVIERNKHNDRYLKTKATKLGHLMQP